MFWSKIEKLIKYNSKGRRQKLEEGIRKKKQKMCKRNGME